MRLITIYLLVITLFATKRRWLLCLWITASPFICNLILIRNDNPFFGSYRIVDYIGYAAGNAKQLIILLDFNRIVLGLLMIASFKISPRAPKGEARNLERWLGILALSVLFSALYSHNVLNAVRKSIDTFGLCYFSFTIGKSWFQSTASREVYVRSFLALGILLAVTCVIEYRTFGEWNLEYYGDAHRVCGPFRYWETLGMTVSLVLYIVWFRLVTIGDKARFWFRIAYILFGIVLLWCIYRTQTRTIMLATATGIMVLLFYSYGDQMSKRLVHRLMLGLILAASAFLLAPELLKDSRFYQQTITRSSTKENREETYVAAVRMFASSPIFGIGLKNFQEDMGDYLRPEEIVYSTAGLTSLHSSYLVFASECGFIGIIPLACVIIFAFRTCLQFRRQSFLPQDRAWAVCMLGMTPTFYLCGITFDPFFDPTIQNHLFYMSLGCVVGRIAEQQHELLSND